MDSYFVILLYHVMTSEHDTNDCVIHAWRILYLRLGKAMLAAHGYHFSSSCAEVWFRSTKTNRGNIARYDSGGNLTALDV